MKSSTTQSPDIYEGTPLFARTMVYRDGAFSQEFLHRIAKDVRQNEGYSVSNDGMASTFETPKHFITIISDCCRIYSITFKEKNDTT